MARNSASGFRFCLAELTDALVLYLPIAAFMSYPRRFNECIQLAASCECQHVEFVSKG